MHTGKMPVAVTALRWVARVWAAAAVLFWGAFLVEHLFEWVFRAGSPLPAEVWVALALHTALIAGLCLGWRWEVLGGAVSVAAAVLFLAGRTTPDQAPWLLLATVTPGCLWLVLGGIGWANRRPGSPTSSAPPVTAA